MPETIRMKPFDLFVPITRVDDEERLVEGYCYVNAEVGDGWNLKRSAMERAAAAYMQFPAVREMHEKRAAGSAEAVSFDDRGCLIRARVVDDDAWNKVKQRVYRGFSIGGRPTFARGKEIEEFEWIETSLVDRPADREAVFTLYRADGVPDECEVPHEPVGPAPTASAVPSVPSGRSDPCDPPDLLARVASLERDRQDLLARLEVLSAEAASERAEKERVLERLEQLRRTPVPAVRSPVRFAGMAREFIANRPTGPEAADAAEVARLSAELQAITDRPAATQAERDRQIQRVMEIKCLLRAYSG